MLNNQSEQLESLFDHVFSTPKDSDMFSRGYEDAWDEKVKRPQYDNDQYRNGWSLGLEYKGK